MYGGLSTGGDGLIICCVFSFCTINRIIVMEIKKLEDKKRDCCHNNFHYINTSSGE